MRRIGSVATALQLTQSQHRQTWLLYAAVP
jgi:hypothetical protein